VNAKKETAMQSLILISRRLIGITLEERSFQRTNYV
jgi:hypothetical protein